MAGIGFELNKLFKEKGLSSKVKAIGYSGIVVAGPLVLGIALVFIISSIAAYYGLSENDRMLLIAMLTYAIMASLSLQESSRFRLRDMFQTGSMFMRTGK